MVERILLFGRTGSGYTERILEALTSFFEESEVFLYVFGVPDPSFDELAHTHCSEVLYDYDLDHDLPAEPDIGYLRSFERRYADPNLWRCLVADRKLTKDGVMRLYHDDNSPYTHRELLRHLEARARPLEAAFETNPFDFVYGQQIMRLGGMLAYTLARATDTPFFRAGTTRIADRFTVHEDVRERSPQVEAAFEAALEDPDGFPISRARDHVEAVRDGGSLYTVPTPSVDDEGGEPNRPLRNAVGSAGRVLLDPASLFSTDYYYETSRAKRLFYRAARRLRRAYTTIVTDFDEFDPEQEYAYFPLQVQPELSLMVWARYHTHFPTVVRNVAQSLPTGMELYVNEHPNMWGSRPPSFYDELRKLPNVRVLPLEVDTGRVIERAELTACVTTSVGLDALCRGVPVVALGNPGYSVLDSVHTPGSLEDLPRSIQRALNEGVDPEELVAYIAANLRVGIPRDRHDFPTQVCRHIDRSLNFPPADAWRVEQ